MKENLEGHIQVYVGWGIDNTGSEGRENIQTGPHWAKRSLMGDESKGIGISLALPQ